MPCSDSIILSLFSKILEIVLCALKLAGIELTFLPTAFNFSISIPVIPLLSCPCSEVNLDQTPVNQSYSLEI